MIWYNPVDLRQARHAPPRIESQCPAKFQHHRTIPTNEDTLAPDNLSDSDIRSNPSDAYTHTYDYAHVFHECLCTYLHIL